MDHQELSSGCSSGLATTITRCSYSACFSTCNDLLDENCTKNMQKVTKFFQLATHGR